MTRFSIYKSGRHWWNLPYTVWSGEWPRGRYLGCYCTRRGAERRVRQLIESGSTGERPGGEIPRPTLVASIEAAK